MQKKFENPRSSLAPAGHIQRIDVPSNGLIRSSLGAATAALVILCLFWLPAEYGIDPTGLGGVMGLTTMGEIKQQLYAEAAAEDAALAMAAALPATARAVPVPSGPSAREAVTTLTPPLAEIAPPVWRDEVSYTLAPTEGIEVKLAMVEGATATFEWTANGAVLNYDTHGDGSGNKIRYDQGRGIPGQEGTLTAAFSGNHGWFWRNRTNKPVVVTLRTRGNYRELRLPAPY